MKRGSIFSKTVHFVGHYLMKLADNILHPLKDIPVPDFNNQYDITML